ncbi:MAG: AI-2E family transporter [Verrucomicrobia bacterium]|nr:AI-2E family transporter [Verrucomicrobiota bacterium]
MNITPPSEKQARILWAALTGLGLAIIIGLIVAGVWGIGQVLRVLSPVIWPLAVAGVLACLLDPVVDFLVKRKVPRLRAIVVVFVMALALIAALAGSVVPRLVYEARELATKSSEYTTKLPARAATLAERPPQWMPKQVVELLRTYSESARSGITNPPPAQTNSVLSDTNTLAELPAIETAPEAGSLKSIAAYATKLLPKFGEWLTQVLGFVGAVFGIIAGLALVPIYAFYFLLEKHGINKQWRDYLPVQDSSFKDEMAFVIGSINDYIVAFFRGQLLVAMCDGVLYTIGFSLIGLPYAVLIGVMATCLTIIPFLGAITTCVSALLIAVVGFGDWQHPALVLGVFAVVQSLEGMVIQPRIMGERVGLHPVVIIIALMTGTTLLGGILGGILAIPLAAVLRVLMFRYVWRKKENSTPRLALK